MKKQNNQDPLILILIGILILFVLGPFLMMGFGMGFMSHMFYDGYSNTGFLNQFIAPLTLAVLILLIIWLIKKINE